MESAHHPSQFTLFGGWGQMTIDIEVHLFANLRLDRFGTALVQIDDPATVKSILALLGIPQADVGAVFVNGRDGTFAQALADGDRLTLLPSIGGG